MTTLTPTNQAFEIVHGGTRLVARRDLGHDVAADFDDACTQLLETPAEEWVIDLSRVRHVNGNCIGQLIWVQLRATERGHRLRLIISRDLEYLFDLMSIRELIETEVVDRAV